jgi:hypothetical protein
MRIFKEYNLKSMRSYPYSIRCQTQLDKDLSALKRFRPNVICIEWLAEFSNEMDPLFEKLMAATNEIEKNNILASLGQDPVKLEKKWWKLLSSVVVYIKSIENYNPVIIIFNARAISTDSFRGQLAYDEIAAVSEHISSDVIFEYIKIWEKQNEKKRQALLLLENTEGKKNNDFFYNPANYTNETSVNLQTTVKILELTESQMTIASEENLQEKNYFLSKPYNLMVRLISDGTVLVDKKRLYKYRGLINLFDTNDKEYFRRITLNRP